MPRNRPPHLYPEFRKSKTYWYVRRSNGPRTPINGKYGSPEFWKAYQTALADGAPAVASLPKQSRTAVKKHVSKTLRAELEACIPSDLLERSKNSDTHVYFLRAGAEVKIGFSKNPRARAKSMRTARPERLEILYTIPGGRELERFFHSKFAKNHSGGEWFWLHGDIENFLSTTPSDEVNTTLLW